MIRLLYILGFVLTALLSAHGQTAFDVAAFEKARVIKAANQYLGEKPLTITASASPRSAGGRHDFFRKAITGGGIPKIRTDLIFSATGCRIRTILSTTAVT